MKNILLFAGSNSAKFINQNLLVAIADLIKKANATVINLRDFPMPMYAAELQHTEGIPVTVTELKKQIDDADALVISVPEHNGSIPAFFKNVLDWLSRAEHNYKVLHNKPVFLLSASPGGGGATSIIHTESILKRLGATVNGKIVVSNFYQRLHFAEGKMQIKDEIILFEITKNLNN